MCHPTRAWMCPPRTAAARTAAIRTAVTPPARAGTAVDRRRPRQERSAGRARPRRLRRPPRHSADLPSPVGGPDRHRQPRRRIHRPRQPRRRIHRHRQPRRHPPPPAAPPPDPPPPAAPPPSWEPSELAPPPVIRRMITSRARDVLLVLVGRRNVRRGCLAGRYDNREQDQNRADGQSPKEYRILRTRSVDADRNHLEA